MNHADSESIRTGMLPVNEMPEKATSISSATSACIAGMEVNIAVIITNPNVIFPLILSGTKNIANHPTIVAKRDRIRN